MDNSEEQNGDYKISEAVKKLITAGLGAAFMTEESVRSYLGDMKLPKDVLNGVLSSANKSKKELLDRVGNEVIRVISKIDFVKEASRFVEEHKFKVSAEIEVVRKKESKSSSEEKVSSTHNIVIR